MNIVENYTHDNQSFSNATFHYRLNLKANLIRWWLRCWWSPKWCCITSRGGSVGPEQIKKKYSAILNLLDFNACKYEHTSKIKSFMITKVTPQTVCLTPSSPPSQLHLVLLGQAVSQLQHWNTYAADSFNTYANTSNSYTSDPHLSCTQWKEW